MGWTSYHATCYKNGKVDRKQECDNYFEGGLNRGYYKVLKSIMKGSTYYAAVQMMMRREKKENGEFVDIPVENGIVFAAVFLTQVDNKSYYNFSYKDMDETCGPCYYECPESILALLSDTDSAYAKKWREQCHKMNALKKLPVGTIIEFKRGEDKTVRLYRHPAAFQFKRPFWFNPEENTYFKENQISLDYEIVKEGEKQIA